MIIEQQLHLNKVAEAGRKKKKKKKHAWNKLELQEHDEQLLNQSSRLFISQSVTYLSMNDLEF